MAGGAGEQGTYRYFLGWKKGGPPAWIGPVQWAVLVLWVLFSLWLLFGGGRRAVISSFYHYHGLYAEEVALKSILLPNWGLVTLALLGLQGWFQVIWLRCGVTVTGTDRGWVWTGRRGPSSVQGMARTPGGAWCRDGRRWWYVPTGFVDADGVDWLSRPGAPASPLFGWMRVASPLALLLLLLLAGAYALEQPGRENRRARAEVYRATVSRRASALAMAVAEHPEFRPWARYLETLPSCDEAACLRAQIAARLELHSIGPEYAADEATLVKLLILSGRSPLAVRLLGRNHPESFEVALREDDPVLARDILGRLRPGAKGKKGATYALLLLEEGRLDEAWSVMAALPAGLNQRTIAVGATVAHLTGRCAEAERKALLLMAPDSLDQIRLEGEAPATGLGALLRYVRRVRFHASCALGLALLGDMTDARSEWARAEELARAGGIPGLLDTERVLLRRVSPGGPWAGRRAPLLARH